MPISTNDIETFIPNQEQNSPAIITILIYCNVRSIRNNLVELHAKIYCGNCKLLIVNWLCEKFSGSLIDSKGLLNIYRRDRRSRFPSGGECIFSSRPKSINSCLHEIDYSPYPDAEIISAIIFLRPNLPRTIVCAYFPSNLEIDLFDQSVSCMKKLCSPRGTV